MCNPKYLYMTSSDSSLLNRSGSSGNKGTTGSFSFDILTETWQTITFITLLFARSSLFFFFYLWWTTRSFSLVRHSTFSVWPLPPQKLREWAMGVKKSILIKENDEWNNGKQITSVYQNVNVKTMNVWRLLLHMLTNAGGHLWPKTW